MNLRLGTRGSALALFQARLVASLLRERCGVDSTLVVIKTSGDRLPEAPLAAIGGKRLFVKEIEEALLAGEIDLAVHSSKDMSAVLPDGLTIAAALPREDARDAIVLGAGVDGGARGTTTMEAVVQTLGSSPRIGTSSVRRTAQLSRLFPRASFTPVRGNLDTRLRKLDGGEHDALVLASAGLVRLGRADRISLALPEEACTPAPGQGIIAVECRTADAKVREIAAKMDDAAAATALDAERAVVVRLGGGCQMPLGAFARVEGAEVTLTAVVSTLDGSRVARAQGRAPASEAARLGAEVGDRLLAEGAGEILASVESIRAAADGIQP